MAVGHSAAMATIIDQHFADCAVAMASIRLSQAYPKCRFPLDLAEGPVMLRMDHLMGIRQSAKLFAL